MTSSVKLHPIEAHLKLGDHLCSFYENKVEQFQIVLPFLKEGLAKEEKCLYIADENTAEEIKAGLLMHGVDVGAILKSGQLKIVTSREAYIRLGKFDPEAMVSFLVSAAKEALSEGYAGLRVAGEASWILRDMSSLDAFIDYEAMVNEALRNLPAKALCQYNTKMFFGNILVKVLKTHPRVLLGLDLYENPFYEALTMQQ